MYSVTDTFKQIAARKDALWERMFTIGGSDYSDDVLKWPTIERNWDEVSPLTVTLDLSNEDRMFNFFMQDKTLLHNQCAIKLGLPIGINLLTYSQAFDNTSVWAATSCTVTANSTVAPDGTTTADTLTDATTGAYGSVSQTNTIVNDSSTYVFSIYVKKTTGGTSPTFEVDLVMSGGTSSVVEIIKLNTDLGTSLAGYTCNVIDAGDYWRVYKSITNNASGNTSFAVGIYPATSAYGETTGTATATGSAIVWGAQLERGTVPSDYTMTTSAAYAPYILVNAADKSANILLNNDVMSNATAGWASARATLGFSSGKWYWEVTFNQNSSAHDVGIGNSSASLATYVGADANGWGYLYDGFKYTGGAYAAYGATHTVGDVVGVALDMDAGTVTFYKNGVSQGVAYTGLTGTLYPMVSMYGNATTPTQSTANFGRNGFAYGPPTGYSPAYVANVEYVTPFTGTIDAVRYTGGKVALTLVDKFKRLSDRVIADTTTPQNYTGSNYLVHDLAWYICTSHGALSAIASTSNPDIDYQSYSSWSAVFSDANTRMQAQFTGQKPMEALKKIALLTQSAIWIENDKVKFSRFSLTGSSTATLSDATIINAEHVLDDRELINAFYVGASYNVNSRSHAVTVSDTSSSSISRYGRREENSMEEYIWLVESVSALNLAQRMINMHSEIKGSFTVTCPLHSVATTIGDTLVYTDSLLQVSDTFRVMRESLDIDAGTKTYTVDQTQILQGFILDVTSLDGTEILT